MNDIIKSIETKRNEEVPDLDAGDIVNVHVRIMESGRDSVQEFKGTVIRTRNSGNNANFTVRRVATNGIGVERTFIYNSPRVEKVVIERKSVVRRSRLYFLRDRTGKSARLKQKIKK